MPDRVTLLHLEMVGETVEVEDREGEGEMVREAAWEAVGWGEPEGVEVVVAEAVAELVVVAVAVGEFVAVAVAVADAVAEAVAEEVASKFPDTVTSAIRASPPAAVPIPRAKQNSGAWSRVVPGSVKVYTWEVVVRADCVVSAIHAEHPDTHPGVAKAAVTPATVQDPPYPLSVDPAILALAVTFTEMPV